MKVPLLKICLSVVVILGCTFEKERLSKEKALSIAKESQEAKMFYQFLDRQHKGCMKEEVVSSCESDWVTCIDDGWVIHFSPREDCSIEHDGRLALNLVINKEGAIISKFPEKEYFQRKDYCLEDYDCIQRQHQCVNFITAPLLEEREGQEQQCVCFHQACQLEES